jgi:type I restriction enzyme, S subunit
LKDRNENRPGYKKTKVGWIPQSWSTDIFDDLFQRLRQPVNVNPQKKYQEIGIRSHGKGIFHKDQIRGVHLGNKSVFWVQAPALVFNIVFAWEQAVAVTSDREKGMIASHRFPMYRTKRSDVVLDYVYRFFLTKRGKHLLGLASPGGAGRNKTLGQGELRRLLVPLPSFQEQKKIAEILSTWDEAIEQMRKLIDAKKRRKKALMQQLLTGKKRLAKFKKHWNLHSLGDLASIVFSNVDKKKHPNELPMRLCNYTDVYYNEEIIEDMPFIMGSVTEREIQKYKLRKGDVIITKDSESSDDIAVPSYVAEELNGVVCGYHLAIIRPKKNLIRGSFLSQLLMTNSIKYQFVRIANGVTRFGLTLESIKRIKISIPTLDEQHFISKILQSADDEIKQLEIKLKVFEKQKRGLIQKLLTGEIRVKT